MKKILNIALIAHDTRKQELYDWVKFNAKSLYPHNLYATGTTGKLLKDITIDEIEETCIQDGTTFYNNLNLTIHTVLSGPLGGDAEIACMIAKGHIDILVFFCDNLSMQPHNADIQGLSRLASLYNIAFATNRTTADMILTSPLFANPCYTPINPDFSDYLNRKI